MGSNQSEKLGCLWRNWLYVVNVCFSRKRTLETLEMRDSDFRIRPEAYIVAP